MKRIREIMGKIVICISVLLYLITFLFTINEYAGKSGMPFVISLSAVTMTIIFLILSIVAMVIGYILSKKGRTITLTSIVILMLNVYKLSEMNTILNLIDKLELPFV